MTRPPCCAPTRYCCWPGRPRTSPSPGCCASGIRPPIIRTWRTGVHWAGPFRLDAVGSTAAGLPHGWSTAYAARAVRSRMRVPDGLDADLVRLRYPHGLPTGAERVAWSLVTGLARRLDGAARLPAGTSRADRSPAALRARAQENTYCVYGNEALPWSVLRSVLCLSLPELDLNGALADDDYCLDRPGGFEVRVRPRFRRGRVRAVSRCAPDAAADWPRTVYRFRCLPQPTEWTRLRTSTHTATRSGLSARGRRRRCAARRRGVSRWSPSPCCIARCRRSSWSWKA